MTRSYDDLVNTVCSYENPKCALSCYLLGLPHYLPEKDLEKNIQNIVSMLDKRVGTLPVRPKLIFDTPYEDIFSVVAQGMGSIVSHKHYLLHKALYRAPSINMVAPNTINKSLDASKSDVPDGREVIIHIGVPFSLEVQQVIKEEMGRPNWNVFVDNESQLREFLDIISIYSSEYWPNDTTWYGDTIKTINAVKECNTKLVSITVLCCYIEFIHWILDSSLYFNNIPIINCMQKLYNVLLTAFNPMPQTRKTINYNMETSSMILDAERELIHTLGIYTKLNFAQRWHPFITPHLDRTFLPELSQKED